MGLESMKSRLIYQGGAEQQNRMIQDKLKSMLSATKYSYQAAKFKEWSANPKKEVAGLFNPISKNENFDTRMISVEFNKGFQVGTYFEHINTNTYWIVFLQNIGELAYFQGECRRCNWSISWVDGDQVRLETLASVIGPSATQLRTSSSMQAKVSEDFPNANLKILIQDNPDNRVFFTRYQTFILDNTAYIIEHIDRLSMPGVIQMQATEHYSNLIEDDVEENIRNAWNIQPIIPQHITDFAIDGPLTVKPQFEATFTTPYNGGHWVIVENMNLPLGRAGLPAVFLGDSITEQSITVVWNTMKSGLYTIGYIMPDGMLYQRSVLVESLI